jgi:hypothetical protein
LLLDHEADEGGFMVPRSLIICNDYFGMPAHGVSDLDPPLKQQVTEILEEKTFPARLAIRSSSVMEDQSGHSAAGLFLTRYYGPPKGDLWSAIIEVLNWNYETISLVYHRSCGITQIPPLPIIIQELVGSEFKYAPEYFFPVAAGIINMASPGEIKVATVPGFGFPAMKGWGLLHVFDFSFNLIAEEEHRNVSLLMEEGEILGLFMQGFRKNRRTANVNCTRAEQAMRRLTPRVQSDLARIAFDLQRKLAVPLDIEWALAKEEDKLPYLLQIRPVMPKQSVPKPDILPADVYLETSEVHGQARYSFSHIIVLDGLESGVLSVEQLEKIGSDYPDNIIFIEHYDAKDTAVEKFYALLPCTRAVVLAPPYSKDKAFADFFRRPDRVGTGLQHIALFCIDEGKLILYVESRWEDFMASIQKGIGSLEIKSKGLFGPGTEIWELSVPLTIAGSDDDKWGMIYR